MATGDKKRAQEQRQYLDTLSNLERSLEETKDIIGGLNQEKRELLRELNETKNELARERSDHDETKTNIILLQKKLYNAESYQEVIKNLQDQREELNAQLHANKKLQNE